MKNLKKEGRREEKEGNNSKRRWEVEDGSELKFEREMFSSCFKQHKNLIMFLVVL
jgi:hypothetical protein